MQSIWIQSPVIFQNSWYTFRSPNPKVDQKRVLPLGGLTVFTPILSETFVHFTFIEKNVLVRRDKNSFKCSYQS